MGQPAPHSEAQAWCACIPREALLQRKLCSCFRGTRAEAMVRLLQTSDISPQYAHVNSSHPPKLRSPCPQPEGSQGAFSEIHT